MNHLEGFILDPCSKCAVESLAPWSRKEETGLLHGLEEVCRSAKTLAAGDLLSHLPCFLTLLSVTVRTRSHRYHHRNGVDRVRSPRRCGTKCCRI